MIQIKICGRISTIRSFINLHRVYSSKLSPPYTMQQLHATKLHRVWGALTDYCRTVTIVTNTIFFTPKRPFSLEKLTNFTRKLSNFRFDGDLLSSE